MYHCFQQTTNNEKDETANKDRDYELFSYAFTICQFFYHLIQMIFVTFSI